MAQVSDFADTIVFKTLVSLLDPLHYIFLSAMSLNVLLANELEKFAHLLCVGIVTFLIVTTAWAIFVMFFQVSIK